MSTSAHVEDQPDIKRNLTLWGIVWINPLVFPPLAQVEIIHFNVHFCQWCLRYFPLKAYLAALTREAHQQTHICRNCDYGITRSHLWFLPGEQQQLGDRSGSFPITGPRPAPPGSRGHPCILPYVCSFLIGSLTNGSRQASAMCPRLRRQSKVASVLPFTCADNSYNHSRHRYDRAPQCCSYIIAAPVVTYLQYPTFTGCVGSTWASIKGAGGGLISVSSQRDGWSGCWPLCPKGHHSL